MAMKFSKQHEREEARLLRKGHVRSWIGLLLSWVPLVGLLFAAGGFLRCKVRLTRRYRRKRSGYLLFASIALVIAIGANMAELWVYSRDPQIVERVGQRVWRFVVGENAVTPGSDVVSGGTDYPDMDSAGLGYVGGLQEESDGLDGDFTGWDDDFDWDNWGDWDDDSQFPTDDGLEWSGEADADWFFDDSWDFDADDLFLTDDDFPEGADDGLDWDLDALFDEAFPEDADAGKTLNVGKGETILPLSE